MRSYKETPHFKHRLFLIRHGETEWSVSKQHTGLSDIPLTPHGEEEATCLKQALKGIPFAKVYVSPLRRAQKTCELAGYKDIATLTDDLYEWDYGDYEGLSTAKIRETKREWNLFKDGVPHGETIEQVAKRADHILEEVSKIPGDVAFFSSGHISRVIGARWVNFAPQNAQYLSLSTASISILSYEHEWRCIHQWNETSHLKTSKHRAH
ncbi:MAG: Acid phosphatase [Chlamydiae bacterium]|nr:Acid phosphatase [Chlamydiota bacterium]